MFENFTFSKGFLIGLAASLVMVASIKLVFAFPWLSFVLFLLIGSFVLGAIRVPESGQGEPARERIRARPEAG